MQVTRGRQKITGRALRRAHFIAHVRALAPAFGRAGAAQVLYKEGAGWRTPEQALHTEDAFDYIVDALTKGK
ncbi:MAG TPA: hypothetical protein VNM39_10750 [Verrucomicrobiae bacterium]|nr:hypothetical protein [Verrucomicrobiae bacterium]